MTTTFEVISEKITTAKRFADVFGEISSNDVAQKLRELRKQYVYMAKFIHPDRVSKDEAEMANTVFRDFVGLYEQAKNALENDSYKKPLTPRDVQSAGVQDSVIATRSHTYVVKNTIWAEGDFSDIHLGKTEDGTPVLIKVATDPTMNQYLEHEFSVYKSMDTHSAKTQVLQYIPKLLDSILVDLPGNRQIRVNVFLYQEGYVSLTKIREVYPKGLDPRDASWIWRRVLGHVITAEMLGVVHGAIVPDHTLVHPITHDPINIGWAHSMPHKGMSTRLTTCIDRWKAWYPKEVFDHKVPTRRTDLYMAGKTMLYLLGGDVIQNHFPKTVPQQVQKIVQRCVDVNPSNRPENGYEVLQQFTNTIHGLWGKTYRKLAVPN